MKISTNSGLYQRKPRWIDFNAGVLAEDKTMDEVVKEFTQKILRTASGEYVNAEKSGIHEIAIFKNGVTL